MENNIYAGYGKSDLSVEKKRRAHSECAERRELLADYGYVKAEQEKTKRAQVTMLEEQLADQLSKSKAEQLRSEMDRRRICEGSEELRALKERLHMAKVNKERAQQLLEIEVRKERNRIADHMLTEHMENERLEQQELEHKLIIEKQKQRERVKVINQQQIAMKEAQREEAMQEYIKERQQVEELVEKIAKEDAKEAKVRSDKQVESRIMLQQFMLDQKAKQEKAEAEERAENERIEQFARDKRAREERLEQERQEKEKEPGLLASSVAQWGQIGGFEEKIRILNAMLGKMEEFELLRNDLHFEEGQAEARRVEEMRMRKKLEDREEMRNAHFIQMQAKEEKMSRAREDEAKLREELMSKFAEDDRIEQLNDHKRRLKVEQHKRETERLIEMRREMFEVARAKERDEQEALKKDEDQRRIIIEEEKKRLLREHGQELKKFLLWARIGSDRAAEPCGGRLHC
ncbi:unnamed protein product [Effrenium voratum]|nr:unnamed protein product [Effrenium voratum]